MPAPSRQSVSGETPLHPTLPLRLGRFVLCEELGAGGMATVYLARMELAAGLERLVALKTIHPHLAREKSFVDMFLDEARIASHVTHPNVCAVHDFGEMGSVYYRAMEHLIGEPLFDVINRLVDRFDDVREVLPFLAARVIADACEGLHAAHTARGPDGARLSIVHRDVSPQNLFVTYDGAVKVVDFGCAKAAQRVAHTSTGVMKGKVGYAAPEQLRADDVDARADVWALGVCLWETLTLSPLFTKDTAMKTAMSVLEADIPFASDDRSWVPEQVAKIAQKALGRDRDGRYASAREMGRDLRKFIADSGFTLESAELAEWMDFLFDDRHQEREEQAARVRELDVSNIAAALPSTIGDVSAADVVLLPDSTSALSAIESAERAESETPPPLPARESPPPIA
jgi:serine/threonine-protein kinase